MSSRFISAVLCAGYLWGGHTSMAQVETYYFKEKRLLTEKGGQLAILRDGRDHATTPTSTALAARGVAANDVKPLGLNGWWQANIAQGNVGRSTTQIRDSVTSAASDPSNTFVSPVFSGSDGGDIIVTPTILVQFSKSVPPDQAEAILVAAGAGEILERNMAGLSNAYKTQCPARDAYTLLQIVNRLATRSDVIFAEPDMITTGRNSYIPNDPWFSRSWWQLNTGQSNGTAGEDIDATEAWDITRGNAAVKVLVIDNGVEMGHLDLNLAAGADFTSQPGVPAGSPVISCDDHGTPVAGCISMRADNMLGGSGIAPDCFSVSARCFVTNAACDGGWRAQYSWTADALNWAQQQGVRITNNSNSYGGTSSIVTAKYAETQNAGMIHFASAGNDNIQGIGYPANLPSVISVGATDRNGARSLFSNHGPGLDITAPGTSIYTTDRTGIAGYGTGDFTTVSGTSFASPIAAGVAALMLSVNPDLTSAQVKNILYTTATDKGTPGWDGQFGNGIVNAQRAVTAAVPVSHVEAWELY